LVLAFLLCSAVAPAQLKISQIYGGGGNAGAPLERDYVEIHNPTGAAVSVAGWSVQYASSSGTTWTVTTLAGAVPAGGYYLVYEGSGTTGISALLPTADATGTIAMSATDGKVALCSSTTALTGGMPTAASIVDFIGYGTLANWREPFVGGTTANNAPQLLGGVVFAEYRRGGGATDTDNNAADFMSGFPSPRNSLTPAGAVTGIGFASPHIVEPGAPTRIVVTPRTAATDGPPPALASVTADLTSIGGTAADALVDDGTSGDEVAGDAMYSRLVTVGVATTAGTKNLPISLDGMGGCYVNILVATIAASTNDSCETAIAVAVPSVTAYDVTGALPEYNPISSTTGFTGGTGMSSKRGLWYTVVGTGNTITVTTCGTSTPVNADTNINVMCGTCDGLAVVASNDQTSGGCGTPLSSNPSTASWCSTMGQTYYVWVGPFSTAASTIMGSVTITDDGTACATQVPCTTCPPPTAGGATAELERGFGPGTNSGCEDSTLAFQDIAASFPQSIMGTARGYFNGRDVDWYRFQATSFGVLTATLTAQFQGNISINSLGAGGTCPATMIASSASSARCASSATTAVMIPGNWYAVRILHAPTPTVFGGVAPGGTSYHYLADLTFVAGAPNDNCASASPLAFSSTYSVSSTEGANNDGSSSCDATGRDVWYSITVPVVGYPVNLMVDTCTSSIDTVATLYGGTCGSLTEITCNDDCGGTPCGATSSCLTVANVAAGTYLLRVSDKGIGLGGVVNVRALLPPGNDDCGGAVPIFEGSNGPYDNTSATDSPGFITPDPCAVGGSAAHPGLKDVFFSYTAPCDGTVDMVTCHVGGLTGTNTDTQLMVYPASSCPGPPAAPLACDDDGCTTPTFNSQVLGMPIVNGVSYLVRVASWGTNVGTFRITVTRHTAASSSVGPGCSDGGGPGPTLTISGPPVLGSTRTITLAGAIPASPGMLFMAGGGAVPSPLPGGCTLYLNNGDLVMLGFLATDLTGTWTLTATVPSDPYLECFRSLLILQAVVLPATGSPFYQVSEGLGLRLGV
jgi:hypothetical protein